MNRPKFRRGAALVLAASLAAPSGAVAATTLKLATLVPEGSVWDRELRSMGADWEKRTNGRVKLRLYPGGVAGDDLDVVRKMRIGQLNAATLTVMGLAQIDEGFNVFAVPRFYADYEELFHVVEALTPLFEQRLDRQGYVLLNWGHAGWVHLFTKQSVQTPADVRRLKLYSSAGDDRMVQWWKRNGYQPVPLSPTDIMTALQTGMIDALPTTPLAALTLQWYRTTPYMLDLGLAPLVGATVITKSAWSKLSEQDRAALKGAAAEVEKRLETAIPEQDRQAIHEMEQRGLTVVRVVGADQEREWNEQAEVFGASMREQMIPEDVFDQARAARDRFRQQRAN